MAEEKAAEQKPAGNLFGAVNALRKADDPDSEDDDERAKANFDETTIAGRIARNQYFEWITLAVICFNALYLGYDCDYSARWGKPDELYNPPTLVGFILLDNFFCAFFTFEVVVRFVGYKTKRTALSDVPFLFDLGLVTVMVLETWVLAFIGTIDALKQVSILRLLRLARLLRMGKIMRYLPELQLIVKGMVAAVRSVACAGILMMLVLYVFSIIFTSEYHQGLKADDDEDLLPVEQLFGSMGKSMRHLLIMGTILDDLTACTNAIRASDSIIMLLVFFVCVLICAFTLFNMLLGILCEVVEATQNREQEKGDIEKINTNIRRFFKSMDANGNGDIDRNEFVSMSFNPEIMAVLAELRISMSEFQKYAALLFTPKNDGDRPPVLQYDDAVSMILRLRPGTMVNACDFGTFRQAITKNNKKILRQMDAMLLTLEECAIQDDDAGDDTHNSHACSDSDVEGSPSSDNKAVDNTMTAGLSVGGEVSQKHRGKPTIGSIARDIHKVKAPTIASKWQAMSPRAGAPSPPPSPLGRRPATTGMVSERVLRMAEMRRIHKNSVRDGLMPAGQLSNNAAFYHGTTDSVIGNAPLAVVDISYADDSDSTDDRHPFSPGRFVLD